MVCGRHVHWKGISDWVSLSIGRNSCKILLFRLSPRVYHTENSDRVNPYCGNNTLDLSSLMVRAIWNMRRLSRMLSCEIQCANTVYLSHVG